MFSPGIRFFPLLWMLGLALAGPPMVQGEGERAVAPLEPVAYLKVAPLLEFLTKLTTVAMLVEPSPMVATLPYLVGGQLGDPPLASVSRVDDLTLIAFGHDDGSAAWAVWMKVNDASSIPKALERLGLKTRLSSDGWLVFSLRADILERLPNPEVVDPILRASRTGDLELAAFPASLKRASPGLKAGFLQALVEHRPFLAEPDLQASLPSLYEQVLEEMVHFEAIKLGLGLGPVSLSLRQTLELAAGSPFGELAGQPVGGPSRCGWFLADEGVVSGVAKLDLPWITRYLDGLLGRLATAAGGRMGAGLEELRSMWIPYLQLRDGSFAFTADFDAETLGPRVRQVVGLAEGVDEGAWAAVSQAYFGFLIDRLQPALNRTLTREGGDAERVEASFLQTELEGVESPVFRIDLQAQPQGVAAEEDPTPTRLFGISMGARQGQQHYLAQVSGFLVEAGHPDDLSATWKAVQAGKPIPRNLSTVFAPTDGVVAQMLLHPGRLVRALRPPDLSPPGAAPEHPDGPFAHESITPLVGSLWVSPRRIQSTLDWSLDSLEALIDALRRASPHPPHDLE